MKRSAQVSRIGVARSGKTVDLGDQSTDGCSLAGDQEFGRSILSDDPGEERFWARLRVRARTNNVTNSTPACETSSGTGLISNWQVWPVSV